ncbi:MFS transporter [Micromonospora maritima]|uniref:MFS transporter n=1 Tax=Micromonospora maritima TaxID=986711 RepID=UPI00157D9DE7|nr:MFS transporter [Micromonospora maritima]
MMSLLLVVFSDRMTPATVARRFPYSSPYWPVLSHSLLRRILPGLTVSALGDGMAVVAVSWLALQLASPGQRGLWVAIAVAAYTVPSVVGTLVFGRVLGGRGGAQLAGWDATLRAGALAAIPVAYVAGALSLGLYVTLLAVSSLLHSWGSAGRYTLIAEVLPVRHHLAGNGVLGIIAEMATIGGPPLAGLLISWGGAVWVIAIDAATFAVLALTYHLAVPATGRPTPTQAGASRTAGFGVIRRNRSLLGLLTLSFGFFFLFGPVYVALPLYITDELHASATLLGTYYMAFGAGALIGGLTVGYLRRWSLWVVTIGIVVGFGLTMLPLGLGAPAGLSLLSFAIGGAVWAPYMPTSMALFQRSTTTVNRPQVLAANGAVTVVAVPAGTMLGGPLVSALGARETLLLCAIAIIAFGVIATGLTALYRLAPTVSDSTLTDGE